VSVSSSSLGGDIQTIKLTYDLIDFRRAATMFSGFLYEIHYYVTKQTDRKKLVIRRTVVSLVKRAPQAKNCF